MEVNTYLSQKPVWIISFLTLICVLLTSGLTGCASSSVGRNATDEIDTAYVNSNSAINHAGDNSPVDAFQNSSQTTKGILIGGTTGAVIGGVSSGAAAALPAAIGGAALGGILGAYIDYHTNIIDRLENRGVKVLVLGDQIMMVMPSVWIFEGRSAHIRAQAYSTLDLVAKFIRQQPTMSVKVATYSNDSPNKQADCFITQQQADKVVRYLWPRSNTRLLTGVGMGGSHLVEANHMAFDQGGNYRIEITFEKLPV